VNEERSAAYTRLMHVLREAGATLDPADRDVIRAAADTRIFATDGRDPEAERALCHVEALLERRVSEARLSSATSDRLADELECCGPITLFAARA
jgi:hypothetical protein